VVLNLAINSRDAMPSGGSLSIETATRHVTMSDEFFMGVPAGDYVSLRVSDSGSGMSDEVRERAFEPFFTTKVRGEGSGLGLATVYGIVKQSGGSTKIYSDLGVGTSMMILLPAVATGEAPDVAIAATQSRQSLSGTETVLVVDDEEALREVTSRMLARNGYHVLTASGGQQAIDIASSFGGPIDLLLTDVIMPAMQGPTVAKEILKLRPDVKVLYTSGHALPVLEAELILGTDFMLVEKPFDQPTLLAHIRKVLDHDS
jgi:CheY-like chemotaxis protein